MEEKEKKNYKKKLMLTFLKVMNFPVVYSSPPTPKKSRTSNKPRRPINKATTNIHPMRHLNIILKVGFERGTIFFLFQTLLAQEAWSLG